MDKDFMLNYFSKAVQPEWEELLKTPRYQQAASKRDAIEQYLLASLYNAPTTMQLSYQNQTNHDLANRR